MNQTANAAEGFRGVAARLLPRGPLDLVWQMLVVVAAYYAWRYARGAVDGSAEASLAHARDLVAAERWMHTYIELDVQNWAVGVGWIADVTAWLYAHMHFWGSLLGLLFIYVAHNRSFCFVRNMLLAAMAISLLGYWLYPTAPPRFLPDLGFSADLGITGNDPSLVDDDPLFNPFAALPSMHVGFSLIFGLSLVRLSRPIALKVLFAMYPLLMTFVVVATGNHWWLDAAFGALAAALAFGVATLLGRLRPERWSFHAEGSSVPAPEIAPAGTASKVAPA